MNKSFELEHQDMFKAIADNFDNPVKISNIFFGKDNLKESNVDKFYSIIIDMKQIEEFNKKSVKLMNDIYNSDYAEIYIILLSNPSLFKVPNYTHLKILLNRISKLDIIYKNKLTVSLKKLSTRLFTNILQTVQQYITISSLLGKSIISAMSVLDILHFANKDGKVSENMFYNDGINTTIDYKKELTLWEINYVPPREFSLKYYPYVLNPSTKSKMLNYSSDRQINRHFMGAMLGFQPFLKIKVRRDHLVSDTIEQLQNRPAHLLMKKLKVKFIDEEGIDEGGVKREFFQLITRDLFDAKYGMFIHDEETRTYSFNPSTFESNMTYKLIGKIIGIAIYNKIILNLYFPKFIYKKLLNIKVTFEDLKEAYPTIGSNMQKLLDYSGDVENDICINFETSEEKFGENYTVELKENGKDIPVTNENRQEYVELYIDYKLNKSIENTFKFFKEGFSGLCNGVIMQSLTAEELELIVCGNTEFDFKAFKRVTVYGDGYNKNSKVIKDFWSIVDTLSLEDKKKLLFFVTGSDRSPIGGLSELNMTISKNGVDSDRLPTSHTCYNQLLLPEYSSKDKLERMLSVAINNSEGFGLQ